MRLFIIYWLFLSTIFTWSFSIFGTPLERPSILEVKAQCLQESSCEWEELKQGFIEATAQILGMYPDFEIYYLARDAELFFDTAVLMTTQANLQGDYNRLHLINITRYTAKSRDLNLYLHQEGITEEALRRGKNFLFVDTGMRGTIFKAIKQHFPEIFRAQLKLQLMGSLASEFPSSRIFIYSLFKDIYLLHPEKNINSAQVFATAICKFEDRPHVTACADGFAKIKGRTVPVQQMNYLIRSDSLATEAHLTEYLSRKHAIAAEAALGEMGDLKAYGSTLEAKHLFLERLRFWRTLRRYLDNNAYDDMKVILQNLRSSPEIKDQLLLQDAYIIVKTQFPEKLSLIPSEYVLGAQFKSKL